jgi:hypothetical protein
VHRVGPINMEFSDDSDDNDDVIESED